MNDDNFKRAWRKAYPNGKTIPTSREYCDDQLIIDLAEAYDENAKLKEQLAAREAKLLEMQNCIDGIISTGYVPTFYKDEMLALREHESRLLEEAYERGNKTGYPLLELHNMIADRRTK